MEKEVKKKEVKKTTPAVKKPSSKDRKYMEAVEAEAIIQIVQYANDEKINKEDIVSLLKHNDKFVLIYYK